MIIVDLTDVLRVVNTSDSSVVETLYEGERALSSETCAHLKEGGSFVLDLTVSAGFFNDSQAKIELWAAPNTDGNRGSYARQGKNILIRRGSRTRS